jgi:peptide/nickel transport system permease protein
VGAYLIRRLLQLVLVLFFVTLTVFTILRLSPGDPVMTMVGSLPDVTPEMIEAARRSLGLDQPIYLQYASWLGNLLRGDMGRSYINKTEVAAVIAARLPASLELAAAAFMLALVIAVPSGILAAVYRRTWIDHLATAFVTIGIAIPGFWLAIMLVLLFSVVLGWLPSSGHVPFMADPLKNLQLLILPSLTMAILLAAPTMRFLRSSMLDVLGEDYVRTARAKGLNERSVVARHALRNALIPTVTWVGLQFAGLIGGGVVVEWVFGWPGLGWLTVHAITSRDYFVVQGTVLVVATVFVVVNLVVDLLYVALDPRVRYR